MRDPHIERLHYEIGSGEGTSYRDPEPLSFETHLGRFEARDGRLTVEPADHFSDEESARVLIEQFLKEWEIESDLDLDIGTIRFTFLRAEIIDRNPPPPGSPQTIAAKAQAGGLALCGAVPSLQVTRGKYPAPPSSFAATLDVERAYRRWLEFRAGREPLQSMAYFVLTIIDTVADSRKRAASALDIEFELLHKFGNLASTRGDIGTARKAPRSGNYRPLTGQEKAWLEQAVRRIIKRLGEHASGKPLLLLTMEDLPKLTS